MNELDINNLVQQFPQLSHITPIAFLIGGVMLWIMGGRLLRGTTAMSSLVLGGLVGFIIAVRLDAGQLMIAWVIGGAVTGALAAWLLFRAWMAITVAIILGLAAPATYLAIQDLAPPPTDGLKISEGDLTQGMDDVAKRLIANHADQPTLGNGAGADAATSSGKHPDAVDRTTLKTTHHRVPDTKPALTPEGLPAAAKDDFGKRVPTPGAGQRSSETNHTGGAFDKALDLPDPEATDNPEGADNAKDADASDVPSIPDAEKIAHGGVDAVRAIAMRTFDRQSEAVKLWWTQQTPDAKQWLMVAAAVGVGLGAILGLLLPNFSAALLTAFTGTVLMLMGANGLMTLYAPQQVQLFERYPQATVVALGLISTVGALIQWTIWRKKTDK